MVLLNNLQTIREVPFWCLRFSLQWLCWLWSYELWHCMVLCKTSREEPWFSMRHIIFCKFMELSTWEASSCPATQDIPCILCNQEVLFPVHNSLSLDLILCKLNSLHVLTLFPENPFWYYHSLYATVCEVVLSLQAFRLQFCLHFSLLLFIVHLCPHHSPIFKHPDIIWRRNWELQ